jgi:hypothetical protein
MSFYGWLAIFFLILLGISVLIYVLVIKAFYWGDKKNAPKPRERSHETDSDRR